VTCLIGEIYEFYSAQAGYPKYHLCVREISGVESACFLFLNSKPGYKDSLVLVDTEIPGLRRSPTGFSIISCSMVLRANAHQLRVFSAKPVTKLPVEIARRLEAVIGRAKSLTADERRMILVALAMVI
jgi:hypothetical protein